MKARVIRRGGEVLVAIPPELEPKVAGEQVEMTARGEDLVISRSRQKPTLEELVATISDENRHEETDWGPPVGDEVW